jgi:hypothetical protein
MTVRVTSIFFARTAGATVHMIRLSGFFKGQDPTVRE